MGYPADAGNRRSGIAARHAEHVSGASAPNDTPFEHGL
jgi:hypothetical protein